MPNRNGQRKTRELSKRRTPELGYYLIVTDAKKTEENYLNGLRKSLPQGLQGKLVIKVCKVNTIELVDETIRIASLHPQYCEPWIVFDHDEVKEFDKIISMADKNGINVGWSNPCIEIWFNAYFGAMPSYQDSVSCCNGFAKQFAKNVGQEYKKKDTAIYQKLYKHGDEKQAVRIAQEKLKEHMRSHNKPSEMCPCTTIHTLVNEIITKTGKYKMFIENLTTI